MSAATALTREQLQDEIFEAIYDAQEMNATITDYAAAVVRRLEQLGIVDFERHAGLPEPLRKIVNSIGAGGFR